MIGALSTRGQKCWVGNVQRMPQTSVSEEIADIFRNYNIDYSIRVCFFFLKRVDIIRNSYFLYGLLVVT